MTHRLTRRRFGIGAAALGALGATSPFPIARAQGAAVKVGLLLPRSGFLALIGQQCQRGADLAVPILKDMGYAVELMNADTESKPDVARTQAEKLIRDGAHILCGAFESGATAAIAQVCEQNGVPFVINIGADPAITEQGYKFTFRNFPTSTMLGTSGLSLFNELFKATGATPKTAVLMHVNDTFGMSMLKGINALMPNARFCGCSMAIVTRRSRDLRKSWARRCNSPHPCSIMRAVGSSRPRVLAKQAARANSGAQWEWSCSPEVLPRLSSAAGRCDRASLRERSQEAIQSHR